MNRKVIITGASGGIGLAIARKLYEEKDRIIACCFHHPEKLSALSGITVFTGDLSKQEEVRRLFKLAEEEFSVPDVLINAAGIADIRLFQESDDENLLRLMNTDLLSCIRCSKEAVRLMLKNKQGKILNLSSVWGSSGASCEAEYSAAKGGIEAFTKALAKELALSHIQVNALSLGAIDTAMNDVLTEEEKAELACDIPAGRLGTPEEVADMVSLMLQAPEYLTGAVIKFDGGWM